VILINKKRSEHHNSIQLYHPIFLIEILQNQVIIFVFLHSNLNNIFEEKRNLVSFTDDKNKELSSTNIRDPPSNTPLNNENQFPRKSILRNTQSKSISLLNADTLLSAIKQQTDGKPFKIIQPLEKDWPKTAINYGIDSGLQPKLNEISPDKIDNQSISAIKRSYASLPISTPAVRNSKPYIYFQTLIIDISKETKIYEEI